MQTEIYCIFMLLGYKQFWVSVSHKNRESNSNNIQ